MSETTPPPGTPPGRPTPAATIEALLAPFQQEAAATRVAVEDRLRVLRRISSAVVAFVAVTTAVVVLVLVILIQNRQTAARTRTAIRTNAELSAQIADCTRVGGRCYEQSQANLRKTIALLVESNKAIAKCARTTETDTDFDACVAAKLAPLKVTPTPTG